MVSPQCLAFAAILLTASTISARANDEIQVYNAEIAKIGQWTFQLHNNYAFIGRKEPDFPGGLIPNHALQGTGEWAWGITDWWEMGFYTPYAVDQELTPYSNAAKIRQLFVIPNAIVDLGFGQNGGAEFVPAARFARKLGENLAVGVEYYTDLGPLQSWLPFNEQQHNIYAVVDFKIGRFDVNAGVGYGLTPGSDRLMYKMIIGTDLTEGVSDKSSEESKTLRRPETRMGSLSRP